MLGNPRAVGSTPAGVPKGKEGDNPFLLLFLLLILVHRSVVWTSFKSQNIFVTHSLISVRIAIALHYRLGQNVLPKVQSFLPQKKENFLPEFFILTKADADTFFHFVCLYFIHPCTVTSQDTTLPSMVDATNLEETGTCCIWGALGIRTMSLTLFHWLHFNYFRLEMLLEMLNKLENFGQVRQ